MATGDLHDALEDAKQIPIITDALEKLGGPEYSLAALAAPACSASFKASSYDAFVRKRRVKIIERLIKKKAINQKPKASAPAVSSHQSSGSPAQRHSAPPSRSSRGAGGCELYFLCSVNQWWFPMRACSVASVPRFAVAEGEPARSSLLVQ